jgi:ferredoxin
MPERRSILVCSCEDTMRLDLGAIERGCGGANIISGHQLCRAEIERFRAAAASGTPITVGCTQEEPLFREVAKECGCHEATFVNLRDTAGWSSDSAKAGAKMAALAAAAEVPTSSLPFVHFESHGVLLIYGRDERAIEAASLLKDHLDVTVLIREPEELVPPRVTEFPIVRGTIGKATGYLGAFEIAVNGYALPQPSSRDSFVFGPARNGAVSHCDILLDLSGGPALFPAADLREGYLRADPGDPSTVLRAVLRARDLVGEFDKPRYIAFEANLCAHSRSRIIGCRRCLDLCPTGAIVPAGDHVAIDENICAGCGQCAAACPTGAASYALPTAEALMRKLRALLTVYREAGGISPILLIHDHDHGGVLIDALARHGEGLPAHVLPFAVNEITQIGLETLAAAFAYGATAVRLLIREKPRHDVMGLRKTVALTEPILAGLGFTGQPLAAIETDDPAALGESLRAIRPGNAATQRATFMPAGSKRDLLKFALSELHRAAPTPIEVVSLPEGAPFGAVELNVESCTLCLACVSACPTGALLDNPERPMLRFTEDLCVQCGLCKSTCPEKVISLTPRLDFRARTAPARVLKEEEPFCCIRCGKPFGVKSMIERVTGKLDGKHWMFQNSASLEMIKMCDDCRVVAITEEGFDPSGAPARPRPRTTEDYLRDREEKS